MPETLERSVPHADPTVARTVSDCALVVMSCDAYRDLWQPFFTLLDRYWPDCPFAVYLVSERETYAQARVTTITPGEGMWSKRLRLALERLGTKYVLLMLEDHFPARCIDTQKMLSRAATLDALGGIVLRLWPRLGPDRMLDGHPGIGELHRLARYRVSTQPSIWNRDVLLQLLRDEEDIWNFEWQGTNRSRALPDGFYVTEQVEFPYRHVVERGRWFWSAAKHYGKQNIGCDFRARPTFAPGISLIKAFNRVWRNAADSIYRLTLKVRSSRHLS